MHFLVIELSERLVDGFDERERVGIFLDYVLEIEQLSRVDEADDHLFVFVRIAALTVQSGNAVMQFIDNLFFDVLGVIGYYREFICKLRACQNTTTRKAADKAVHKAHTYGAVVVFHNSVGVGFSVDEIACDGDNGVNDEVNEKEIELWIFFAEVFRYDVRAARRAVALEQYAEAKSAYKSGNHNGIYRVADDVAVFHSNVLKAVQRGGYGGNFLK